MVPTEDRKTLKLAIPKGRMYDGVATLLAEAGIHVSQTARSYRPYVNLDDGEVKILKPQNIVEMLHAGSRDLGFAGADWVAELDGELVELVDTGLLALAAEDLGLTISKRELQQNVSSNPIFRDASGRFDRV